MRWRQGRFGARQLSGAPEGQADRGRAGLGPGSKAGQEAEDAWVRASEWLPSGLVHVMYLFDRRS